MLRPRHGALRGLCLKHTDLLVSIEEIAQETVVKLHEEPDFKVWSIGSGCLGTWVTTCYRWQVPMDGQWLLGTSHGKGLGAVHQSETVLQHGLQLGQGLRWALNPIILISLHLFYGASILKRKGQEWGRPDFNPGSVPHRRTVGDLLNLTSFIFLCAKWEWWYQVITCVEFTLCFVWFKGALHILTEVILPKAWKSQSLASRSKTLPTWEIFFLGYCLRTGYNVLCKLCLEDLYLKLKKKKNASHIWATEHLGIKAKVRVGCWAWIQSERQMVKGIHRASPPPARAQMTLTAAGSKELPWPGPCPIGHDICQHSTL